MGAITERGLNGSPDQAEKWGLQLPLVRAESAITAAQSMLANPTPSTAGERAQVVEDLLMYAGDNGYGHIDYADTMRHAAALLSAPALPVPSDSDDLIKALADVRDLSQSLNAAANWSMRGWKLWHSPSPFQPTSGRALPLLPCQWGSCQQALEQSD